MPRIPPDDAAQIPQTAGASDGTTSTLFRVMAHRPGIMQNAMQLLDAAMRTGTVDAKLKELLAIRVSQVNYCYY
ncbi:MAG TPA: carboxymuconolactone decarboxylase family protein [Ktedonobacteraceae bacterium]|nr:carboxymuconolactone decarboxylase family protein [Ktedonobacteraceae bacterium]